MPTIHRAKIVSVKDKVAKSGTPLRVIELKLDDGRLLKEHMPTQYRYGQHRMNEYMTAQKKGYISITLKKEEYQGVEMYRPHLILPPISKVRWGIHYLSIALSWIADKMRLDYAE